MESVKKFWRNTNLSLKAGLLLTAIFIIIGFVVYFLPHTNPFTFNSYPGKLKPSSEHLLGTTSMGQDVLWLLIEAIHNSLMIGLIVATIGTVAGVFIGLLAGFSGGFLDRVLTVVTDTFIVIPSLPILILMTSFMKGSSTVFIMALVLAMFAWAWPSRQIRSMALSMRERDFIHTAWFSGEGTIQVVVTEILPYAFTWSLSNFMNATLVAIASESSLAVLGLSPGNLISLGNMIQWARDRNAIFTKQWFWIGSPIITTAVMFIGLFLLITGYNDYLSRKRGR
ncbi:peptide/nickel transport system permease protein [Anaerocolumna jejuensis DSM 15929]|uniref:Peptide/nickel transport system permease protein n=1 Tax=Anaerocolumna jejuensis DSM 15929 TaxID=1121322 RepID=A0A1M6PZA3_9FIRM|nr:ABC transporter permease [Anaerocolumna jejuensis]SHK13280.1 peptide/nickel transport system permease protein [Anaerocolumna jejuensis DSM 15929]